MTNIRTDEEIVAKIQMTEASARDWLGTIREDLIVTLPFSLAKPYLLPDVEEKDWTPRPRDPASIRARMKQYMPFAWEKANNQRGISAGRSLNHMEAWLWLLGEDEAAASLEDYTHYGKPQLRAICEAFDWDWTQWDDGEWTNGEDDKAIPSEIIFNLPLKKDLGE